MMHAAYPMIDNLLTLLQANSHVYLDVAGLIWSYPLKEVNRYIERIVDAGFEDRVMFGTDQMYWPKLMATSIGVIQNEGRSLSQLTFGIFFGVHSVRGRRKLLAVHESLFKSPEAEATYRASYEVSLRLWPTPSESIEIPTSFGVTHVVACGTTAGVPVVLLPAMSLSATMWYATVSGLCDRFRCYAADFPSDIGLSVATKPPANCSDCVVWLNELLNGLGIARASFVGASYGSFQALNYARAEPARVKQLVITSPAAGLVGLWSFYPRIFLSLILPGGSVVERILHWVFAERFSLDHPVIQQLIVGSKTLQPRLKVYPKIFSDSQLAGISVPLYLLLGEREVCYNPKSAARRARRLMPHALVEVLPDTGHLLVMECPSAVNQRILAFLRD